MSINENTDLGTGNYEAASEKQREAAVPVVREYIVGEGEPVYDTGMHKISILVKLTRFEVLKKALNDLGVKGMTVTQVMGCGVQKGAADDVHCVVVNASNFHQYLLIGGAS